MRLYKFKNISNATLLYGVQIALAVGAVAIGENWTLASGTALATLGTWLSHKLGVRHIEERLKKHPKAHKFSPNLQYMVDLLYKQSGLKADKHPVYDFTTKEDEPGEEKGFWGELIAEHFEKGALVPNAAASNYSKPIVIISEPLLELLDDDEEFAVLGHEFVHVAAQHQKASAPHSFIGAVAKTSNNLMILGQKILSGWGLVVAPFAGKTASSVYSLANQEFVLVNSYRDKDSRAEMSEEEKELAREAKKRADIVQKTVSALSYHSFNPAYIPIYVSAKAINKGCTLTEKSLSRRFEFMADRGTVDLGASPLALITALRKIEAIYARSTYNLLGFNPREESKNWLKKFWKEAHSTHPSTQRRIKKLSKIARKKGFSEDDIRKAVEEPVDISKIKDIPQEIVEMMVKQLHLSSFFEHQTEEQQSTMREKILFAKHTIEDYFQHRNDNDNSPPSNTTADESENHAKATLA